MAEVKQRGTKKKGNGLSSPLRKLYETVAVKDMAYPIFHAVRGKFITNTDSIGCADSAPLRSELSWTHYRLILPTEEELRREIERERDLVVREQGALYG